MSKGIKIVKAGSDINTHDPAQIAVDTKNLGSLKIYKTFSFNNATPTTSTLNGLGFGVGTYVYEHELGYSPAFIAYRYTPDSSYTELLPASAPIGTSGSYQVYSTLKYIYVINIPIESLSPPSAQYTVVTIFAESLDSD